MAVQQEPEMAYLPGRGGDVKPQDELMDGIVHHMESFDPVEKPAHYQGVVKDIEAVEVIQEVLGNYENMGLDAEDHYYLGNVLKYILRAPFKGKVTEDLNKACWYLKRLTDG